ncbi:MAG: competence/damage-inducible protein A, partial [Bacteroidota bacterium]
MKAEIITIGDELLIGQVVDTNSAWMGQQLNLYGIKVHQITSVSDDEEHILKALKEAEARVDLILITGGLGPTKDDITKVTLCKYFNVSMVFNQAAFDNLAEVFRRFGKEVTERNRSQAEVPENCIPIINKRGTAPGMWFER